VYGKIQAIVVVCHFSVPFAECALFLRAKFSRVPAAHPRPHGFPEAETGPILARYISVSKALDAFHRHGAILAPTNGAVNVLGLSGGAGGFGHGRHRTGDTTLPETNGRVKMESISDIVDMDP